MLLDLERGRPIEVEVILGEVVRMARKSGVSMPVSNISKKNFNGSYSGNLFVAHRNAVRVASCGAEPDIAEVGREGSPYVAIWFVREPADI
jgi:Ketopantoate reductase PanE/ApbA C terminal